MSLIYITGISGSGKSTVLKKLQELGFEAHGVDEEGFADWIDRRNGLIVPFPRTEAEVDIHDWYKKHRWVFSYERISKLRAKSDKQQTVIFLGGVAEGEKGVWPLFDRVIMLSVDEATIRQRIESRNDNHFGKTPEEMADILKWLKDSVDNYRRFGATIIDATKPLNEVVIEVIKAATEMQVQHLSSIRHR